jgi:hypothetical protein
MRTSNADVETESSAVSLLADGLALVYHEGRHVRHLVRAGRVDPGGWEVLLSLPTNRVDAWREVCRLGFVGTKQSVPPMKIEAIVAICFPI